MIWLASFPRSGNTFFRIILHEVYGIKSSTFHRETSYPVDSDYDQYAVVKTHLLPHQLVPKDPQIPAIYLVRDGRDALVSIAHHRSDLVAPHSSYTDNLREAIIAAEGSYFGGWTVHVTEWMKRASIVIRFEDLIRDPIGCVERIRPWIKLSPPNREKLPIFNDLQNKNMPYGIGIDRHLKSEEIEWRKKKHFRRGAVGSWKDEMPEGFLDLFWDLHGPAMKRLGYSRGESVAKRVLRFIKKRRITK